MAATPTLRQLRPRQDNAGDSLPASRKLTRPQRHHELGQPLRTVGL